MKIGIDTNIFIAAIHKSHPNNLAASSWLNSVIINHDVVMAQHSVLETYSVLTRLPPKWRLTSSEVVLLLRTNLKSQINIVHFPSKSFLGWIDKSALKNITGGQIYDSYIIKTLSAAKVDAIATFNIPHFSKLVDDVKLINPLNPHSKTS